MDIETLKQEYLRKKRLISASQRNLDIFEYRYGLLGKEPHTLKATGEKFRISGHRVTQIAAKIAWDIEKLDIS